MNSLRSHQEITTCQTSEPSLRASSMNLLIRIFSRTASRFHCRQSIFEDSDICATPSHDGCPASEVRSECIGPMSGSANCFLPSADGDQGRSVLFSSSDADRRTCPSGSQTFLLSEPLVKCMYRKKFWAEGRSLRHSNIDVDGIGYTRTQSDEGRPTIQI